MNTEIEIWKDIPGYEGYYQCSNNGQIMSAYTNKKIKPYLFKKASYLVIQLRKNKIRNIEYLHHIVANTFLNHISNGYDTVIDHINNNKFDNRLSNLQLIAHRENISKDVKKIKKRTSIYVGVHFMKNTKKWMARIRICKEHVYLGSFSSEIEAHNEYQNALKNLKNNEI